MCSKPIFCSKIALKGKTCSRLLKPQKVAPNAKSCSKVAEHNRDRPTPRANPRALAFFLSRMANSRGWGHFSCQMPRRVDEGRGQMPRPRDRTSPINTAAVFIHCTIIPLSAFLCVIFHFCRTTSPFSIVCNGTIRC